jgi:hypothetical protein
MACFPAITTTALFVAIVLLDLYNREWYRIPGRALLGVFAVLLVLFICQRTNEFVAWILLLAPFGLVFLSYLFSIWATQEPSSDTKPAEEPCRSVCPCCQMRRCGCRRPCFRPRPVCPKPNCPECPKPDCPKPTPEPKPDNCIKNSLE